MSWRLLIWSEAQTLLGITAGCKRWDRTFRHVRHKTTVDIQKCPNKPVLFIHDITWDEAIFIKVFPKTSPPPSLPNQIHPSWIPWIPIPCPWPGVVVWCAGAGKGAVQCSAAVGRQAVPAKVCKVPGSAGRQVAGAVAVQRWQAGGRYGGGRQAGSFSEKRIHFLHSPSVLVRSFEAKHRLISPQRDYGLNCLTCACWRSVKSFVMDV